MNKVDFLPLGSVVKLIGAELPLLIVGRGLFVKNEIETGYVDYSAAPFPEGLTKDGLIYFNSEAIEEVMFKGYTDVEDRIAVKAMNEYLVEHDDLIYAHPESWNKTS